MFLIIEGELLSRITTYFNFEITLLNLVRFGYRSSS